MGFERRIRGWGREGQIPLPDHDGDDTWPTEAADTLIGLAAMAVAGLALIGLVAVWRRR